MHGSQATSEALNDGTKKHMLERRSLLSIISKVADGFSLFSFIYVFVEKYHLVSHSPSIDHSSYVYATQQGLKNYFSLAFL